MIFLKPKKKKEIKIEKRFKKRVRLCIMMVLIENNFSFKIIDQKVVPFLKRFLLITTYFLLKSTWKNVLFMNEYNFLVKRYL